MIETSNGKRSSAFSWWLRTGKLPPALSPDGLELKFNPWHDPEDGRFTFAGAGRHYVRAGPARLAVRNAGLRPVPMAPLFYGIVASRGLRHCQRRERHVLKRRREMASGR